VKQWDFRTLPRPEAAAVRRDHEEEGVLLPPLLEAHVLRTLGLYDAAWHALQHVDAALPTADGRTRRRIEEFLLAYYLGKDVNLEDGGGETNDPARLELLAEQRIARSVRLTGLDRLPEAIREAHFARDLITSLRDGPQRATIETLLERQLAHLYAYGAEYRAAEAAAQRVAELSRDGDWYARGWAQYLLGFVGWMSGRLEEALEAFVAAEHDLEPDGGPLWRWTRFCRATVGIELDVVDEQSALLSGYGSRIDRAYLALRGGDLDVARQLLQDATNEPSEIVVGALLTARLGRRLEARDALRRARRQFRAAGFLHHALACDIHIGYMGAPDRADRDRALRAWHVLLEHGAVGYWWSDRAVTEWLLIQDRHLEPTVRTTLESRLLRHAARTGVGPTRSVTTVRLQLIASGLTDREIDILAAIEAGTLAGTSLSRTQLAQLLLMSPNTLRVHLTRLRSKLGVTARRGDGALLDAATQAR
jgi:DNA-binding CsgD family transcriptional regulator